MIHPDGSGPLAPGQLAGLVRSRQSALGGSAPVTSLLTCNSDYSHFVECIPGSVQQLSLSDLSVLPLGALAGQPWGGTLFDGHEGIETAVSWIADTQSTTWQFVPGQAGSLAPVLGAAPLR